MDFKQTEGIRIFLFNTCNFPCNSPMHLVRILFIDLTERILQRILINPYGSSQLISLKILQGALDKLPHRYKS